MSNAKRTWIPALLIIIVAVTLWFGSGVLWRMLLAMHGHR